MIAIFTKKNKILKPMVVLMNAALPNLNLIIYAMRHALMEHIMI